MNCSFRFWRKTIIIWTGLKINKCIEFVQHFKMNSWEIVNFPSLPRNYWPAEILPCQRTVHKVLRSETVHPHPWPRADHRVTTSGTPGGFNWPKVPLWNHIVQTFRVLPLTVESPSPLPSGSDQEYYIHPSTIWFVAYCLYCLTTYSRAAFNWEERCGGYIKLKYHIRV